MESMGKMLLMLGLAMAALGLLLWGAASIPYIGRLPGDLYLRRGNLTFYFPLTTCILLSLIITLVLALLRR